MKYRLIIDKNAEEEIIAIVHHPSSLTEQIENLVYHYKGCDCIIVHHEDKLQKLPFKEIECITVLNRRVIAIDSAGKQYRIQDRLRDLEEILPSYFIRINKSSLANEHCILCFEAGFGGGIDAIFHCGHKDYVSRRCFAKIKRRYIGK